MTHLSRQLRLEPLDARLVPDATILPLEPGLVAGQVWDDANGNGLREASEKGIAGVEVEVHNEADAGPIAAIKTDADGSYSLPLPKGEYMLEVTPPDDFTFTVPGVVSLDGKDNSGVDDDTGMAEFKATDTTPIKLNAGLVRATAIPPKNLAPTVAPIKAIVIHEGQAVELTVLATDPEKDTLNYAWDLNGDGKFTDAAGLTPKVEWSRLQSLGINDSGPARPIAVRVSDGHHDAVEAVGKLRVVNVAPTAVLSLVGTVAEGGNGRVAFGRVTEPAQADRAAGFHYAYDFNNDGKWDLGDGTTYAGGMADSGAAIPAKVLANSGARVIKARVFDKDGGFTEAHVNVSVRNAVPRGTFKADGPVAEGSTATVSFTNVTDPSPADTRIGFRYAYDFNNDGTYEVGDGKTFAGGVKSPTATVPATVLRDNGSYPVRARVFDKDGGYSEYIALVRVTNVAPTATVAVNGLAKAGTPTALAFTVSDPSPRDAAAGFRYYVDFDRDGKYEVIGRDSTVSHTFDKAGTYTVSARVQDKDGGLADLIRLTVVVQPADPVV